MPELTENLILIDTDGVLVDFTDLFVDKLNDKFGCDYTYEDITSFAYTNLTPAQREYMYELWHTPDMYDKLVLSKDWQDVIDGLREIGRVVACSSPLVGHVESKYRFLSRYFDRADIVLASDKDLVDGDILIDDNPKNIRAFSGHTIIFDRPWNRTLRGPRARTCDDLGPLVQDYYITQELLDDFELFAV